MTGADGRLLGLAHFDSNPLAHHPSQRTGLGLTGTPTGGPGDSRAAGSTIPGLSSQAIGTATLHMDGVNRSAASLIVPPPPLELPVSMAEELLRLRTQVQELQTNQRVPPVSRSRERRRRRNVSQPTQTADTVRVSAFIRLGPLCRIGASGRVHLESRRRTDPRSDASGNGRIRRTLFPETSATASSARSRSRGRQERSEGVLRISDRGNGTGNPIDLPVGSQGHQDNQGMNRSPGRRYEDPERETATRFRQRSPGHSTSRSLHQPRQFDQDHQRRSPRQSAGWSRPLEEDSQGLLQEERCKVSIGGGALTVVNTRTSERTTYRAAQCPLVRAGPKVLSALGEIKKSVPLIL